MPEPIIQQLLFHGTFGTSTEDMSILGWMHGVGQWFSREEIGAAFMGFGNAKQMVEVAPLELKYFSKMRTSTLSTLVPKKHIQVCQVPVFSGLRQASILQAWLDILNTNK